MIIRFIVRWEKKNQKKKKNELSWSVEILIDDWNLESILLRELEIVPTRLRRWPTLFPVSTVKLMSSIIKKLSNFFSNKKKKNCIYIPHLQTFHLHIRRDYWVVE